MMNESIKNLVQRARIGCADFGDEVYYVCTEETFEKFTDLLVQECVNRVLHLRGYSGYNDTDIVSTPDWNFVLDAAVTEVEKLKNG